MTIQNKARYLLWSTLQHFTADTHCPFCGSSNTIRLKRKFIVTSLFCCNACALMFRVPKDDVAATKRFYQRQYTQGFTTDCPDEAMLSQLKTTHFRGSEKDYSSYNAILAACGVTSGAVIYDFGSSWGYGSWQFSQSGYRVYSYEINRLRAAYGATHLGCTMLEQPELVPEEVDCFFSAHVIEHLSDPRTLWSLAQHVLKPSGVVVLFMPNGERSREHLHGNQYHKLWGQVHPLLLSAEALRNMAAHYGFTGKAYSSPYDLGAIRSGGSGCLDGDELLFVARPQREG
jgi:2-polyprenyl-3-methyl-5-hydroxy-6-metoxy-1,4-benzoquinol methylase